MTIFSIGGVKIKINLQQIYFHFQHRRRKNKNKSAAADYNAFLDYYRLYLDGAYSIFGAYSA